MYTGIHVKFPLFLLDVNETGIFSLDFIFYYFTKHFNSLILIYQPIHFYIQ